MTASPDELLVGTMCLLIVVPWIAWTLRRGLRQGALPVGRGYVRRDERPGPFWALLASYVVAILLMAFVGIDLLFGLTS